MGLGSMIFGDPERKRKEKQQVDLDNDYYLRARAYNKAKTDERIRIAKQRGTLAAQKAANKKPFHQKLMGAAASIGKDLASPPKSKGRSQPGLFGGNPETLFNWGEPKPKHSKRRRKHK